MVERHQRISRPLDFPLPSMLRRIRKSIQKFPKATLFELRDQGYNTLFQQLLACVISIRTYDEVSLPVSLKLFQKADSPDKILRLSIDELDNLLTPATFHRQKAQTIHDIAQTTLKKYGGQLPAEDKALQSLKGVGPKCAHLALGIAANIPLIGVDIHVHRVTNRWGYVQASSPEKTLKQLESQLPAQYWIELNELLVPLGKHICTFGKPWCSRCPVFKECRRVGVTEWR